jgi:hypothetical protein
VDVVINKPYRFQDEVDQYTLGVALNLGDKGFFLSMVLAGSEKSRCTTEMGWLIVGGMWDDLNMQAW